MTRAERRHSRDKVIKRKTKIMQRNRLPNETEPGKLDGSDGQKYLAGYGHEYWSRRSKHRDPGAYTKKLTHRAERRQGKKEADDG